MEKERPEPSLITYIPLPRQQSKRGDMVTVALGSMEVKVKAKLSAWNALHSLLKKRGGPKRRNTFNEILQLAGAHPDLFLLIAIHKLTYPQRPLDKQAYNKMNREWHIAHTEKERKRYEFQHLSARLFDFLHYLKEPVWGKVGMKRLGKNIPEYLSHFHSEILYGRGRLNFAEAVRECMKPVYPGRIKNMSRSAFAKNFCHGSSNNWANLFWGPLDLESPSWTALGIEWEFMPRADKHLILGVPLYRLKRSDAFEFLKKNGPISKYFTALFCFCHTFALEAEELGKMNPDVADMLKRVVEYRNQ